MKKLMILWLTRQLNKTKFDSAAAFTATQSALIGAQAYMVTPEATQMLQEAGSPDWLTLLIRLLPTIIASVFGVHSTKTLEDAGAADQVGKKAGIIRLLEILPEILQSIFTRDPERQAARQARRAERRQRKDENKAARKAQKNGSGL